MAIELIDLCSIQLPINYQQVVDSGVQGVYVQCTRYSSTVDYRYDEIVEGFQKAGLKAIGPYHFCSQATDAIKQVEWFWAHAGKLGTQPGELPPMLDWEFCKPGLSPIVCVSWLLTALKRAEELWYPDNYKAHLKTPPEGFIERLPVTYTYPYFSTQHQPQLGNTAELAKYPLDFAAYKSENGKLVPWLPPEDMKPEDMGYLYRTPKPWTKPLLWQYSGNNGLKTPGIRADCDRQRFLGSSAEWDLFRGIYRPADSITYEIKD